MLGLKDIIKTNKGFSSADIVTSVIILMIFTGLVASLFYNYYISNSKIARNSVACLCIIDTIENIQKMEYKDITNETIALKIQELYNNNIIPKQYKVTANVEKYNETVGNESKEDIIKILNINVEYSLNNKIQNLSIKNIVTLQGV